MTLHHIAGLAAANTTDNRGTQLMQLWAQSGKAAPFVIGELTQVVHVGDVAPADAGTDGPTGFDASGDKVPPDGPGGGGCGCVTADARSTGGLTSLTLFGIALIAARRRRTRR
jgi:MYXO-CTERM domain-containing protein